MSNDAKLTLSVLVMISAAMLAIAGMVPSNAGDVATTIIRAIAGAF